MTENVKSQPRVYSELNDSHTIIHAGGRRTIAAAITTVNIATTFVSPLRQAPMKEVEISRHDQPRVAAAMVEHLRGLPIRDSTEAAGLDAYCTFVVEVDNQGRVELFSDPPAPQPGDPDHYDTFLERICRLYTERFADPKDLNEGSSLTVEDALRAVARKYPGLLQRAGKLAIESELEGAAELHAVLRTLDSAVPIE